MMKAFALINIRKATVPSKVTVELLNVCKKEFVRRLAKVANKMLDRNKMLEC